jgi:hypothetical protein
MTVHRRCPSSSGDHCDDPGSRIAFVSRVESEPGRTGIAWRLIAVGGWVVAARARFPVASHEAGGSGLGREHAAMNPGGRCPRGLLRHPRACATVLATRRPGYGRPRDRREPITMAPFVRRVAALRTPRRGQRIGPRAGHRAGRPSDPVDRSRMRAQAGGAWRNVLEEAGRPRC